MTVAGEARAPKLRIESRARDRLAPSPGLILLVSVLAMSWAGPLVRFTTAPAVVVAAWRLVLSVAIIGLIVGVRGGALRGARELGVRGWALAALSGLLLAGHFWTWIASLELTTVSSSVVLVSTQPLFVGVFSAVFLGERPGRRQWFGIIIAVAGAVVIGFGDFGLDRAALVGDLLAVCGAVLAAGYYVIGRRLRQRLDLWTYTGVVYGIAAALLVVASLAQPGVSLAGYAATDWLVFLALALGPMLLGHTGVNYALRYVRAYVANLSLLGEPVGATLIAWLIPSIGEVPAAQTIAGGALILGGIVLGTWRTAPADGAGRA